MRIVGVTGSGSEAFAAELGHGADPEVVAFEQGYRVRRPLDATRQADGELALRLEVERTTGGPAPRRRLRGRDPDLPPETDEPVLRRQRFAAYAVVRSTAGLLATEYSPRTAVAGRWGMPGGGIDAGEEPRDAVVREVAEETSQVIDLGALVRVQTSHWVGRSPHGVLEDFHAVRLVYAGDCPSPTEPVLLDVGGTTRSARWVPLDQWSELGWTSGWREILGGLL